MGPISRLVGRPPFEPSLSKGVLPLILVANGSNGTISLTQTFNCILFHVCNDGYFGGTKRKNGDGGTMVFTAALNRNLFYFLMDNILECKSKKRGSGNNRVCRNLKMVVNNNVPCANQYSP